MNGEEVLDHLSTPSGKLTAKDIKRSGRACWWTRPRDGTRDYLGE